MLADSSGDNLTGSRGESGGTKLEFSGWCFGPFILLVVCVHICTESTILVPT